MVWRNRWGGGGLLAAYAAELKFPGTETYRPESEISVLCL